MAEPDLLKPRIPLKKVFTTTPADRRKYKKDIMEYNKQLIEDYNLKKQQEAEIIKMKEDYEKKYNEWVRQSNITLSNLEAEQKAYLQSISQQVTTIGKDLQKSASELSQITYESSTGEYLGTYNPSTEIFVDFTGKKYKTSNPDSILKSLAKQEAKTPTTTPFFTQLKPGSVITPVKQQTTSLQTFIGSVTLPKSPAPTTSTKITNTQTSVPSITQQLKTTANKYSTALSSTLVGSQIKTTTSKAYSIISTAPLTTTIKTATSPLTTTIKTTASKVSSSLKSFLGIK